MLLFCAKQDDTGKVDARLHVHARKTVMRLWLESGKAECVTLRQYLCRNTSSSDLLSGMLLQVAAIHLHPEPFSIENGMMTPTFKVKRPQAKTAFQKQLDAMYDKLSK